MTSTSTQNPTVDADHQPNYPCIVMPTSKEEFSLATCNGNHHCRTICFQSVASNMNRSHIISITASQRSWELRRYYHTTFDVWFMCKEAAFEAGFYCFIKEVLSFILILLHFLICKESVSPSNTVISRSCLKEGS